MTHLLIPSTISFSLIISLNVLYHWLYPIKNNSNLEDYCGFDNRSSKDCVNGIWFQRNNAISRTKTFTVFPIQDNRNLKRGIHCAQPADVSASAQHVSGQKSFFKFAVKALAGYRGVLSRVKQGSKPITDLISSWLQLKKGLTVRKDYDICHKSPNSSSNPVCLHKVF